MSVQHSAVAIPYLLETVAFLLTVVTVVPISKRFNVSPILGYLLVGAIIGPYSLGVVSDVDSVRRFAELGVVFLLFAIGLELSFDRLRAFSRWIFGLGSAQVILSAVVIGAIAYAWGNTLPTAIVIGLCMALSSTAMVMQLLQERGESAAAHGRASFAVLLLQDLAVVPILILLALLGADNDQSIITSVLLAVLKAMIAVAAIVLLGRFGLRYLFRSMAKTHSVDVFTATILLTVLAISLMTGIAGLSMALGAFLAGLLLAETEFRHQIESEIQPVKGLFLGLFFMGVGMSIDFAVVAEKIVWVILSVFGLIAIKASITAALARLFGLPTHDALRTGLLLAEAGEFAFVVIGQAVVQHSLIDPETGYFMVIVAGISMALTPLLAFLGARVSAVLAPKPLSNNELNDQPEQAMFGHVIIAGYGRVGQAVAAVLRATNVPYIALDTDAERVKNHRLNAEPVYYGNAARTDVLRLAGAEQASALLVTLDDPATAEHVVQSSRRLWPELQILVRAHDTAHSDELHSLGANAVVPETLEASLQLAGYVLRASGMEAHEVNACLETIRGNEYETVRPIDAEATEKSA